MYKRGCRVIVHTCRFKVNLKNDGFSLNSRDFGFHYYNAVNLKSGYLSLKMKKVCTPPSHRLSLYQTCCSFMCANTYFNTICVHPLKVHTVYSKCVQLNWPRNWNLFYPSFVNFSTFIFNWYFLRNSAISFIIFVLWW